VQLHVHVNHDVNVCTVLQSSAARNSQWAKHSHRALHCLYYSVSQAQRWSAEGVADVHVMVHVDVAAKLPGLHEAVVCGCP
jgi:hypothetical protein